MAARFDDRAAGIAAGVVDLAHANGWEREDLVLDHVCGHVFKRDGRLTKTISAPKVLTEGALILRCQFWSRKLGG